MSTATQPLSTRKPSRPSKAKALTFLLVLLLPSTALLAEPANLTAFDEESQAYIRSRGASLKERDDQKEKPPLGRVRNNHLFKWLMPFCTDLTPYLEDGSNGIVVGKTEKMVARMACQHFQPAVLPDGWSINPIAQDGDGGTLIDWYPNDENGGKRLYKRVPNTICPIHTWPNGNPVWFWAWEHRKGGSKAIMLHCYNMKDDIVLVAHKDGGMGVEKPTAEDLLKLAMQYFRLPPLSLKVPEDWQPVIDIRRRDGRFVSGTISGNFSGDNNRSGGLGRWGRLGKLSWPSHEGLFFYDGFNLALLVSPIDNGRAAGLASGPFDIDWDAVEKRQKEKAEKAKEQ